MASAKKNGSHGGRRPGAGRPRQITGPAKKKSVAVTVPAEPRKNSSMSAEEMRLLSARLRGRSGLKPVARENLNPFQLPKFPPGAVPADKGAKMAMDQNVGWASQDWIAGGAAGLINSVSTQGLLFLGYPYLSELAQRAEYRILSETPAEDATRKWIDFEVTGDDDEADSGEETGAISAEDPGATQGASDKDTVKEQKLMDRAGLTDPASAQQRGFRDLDPDERKKKIEAAGKMDKVKALKDEMNRLEVRDRFYALSRDDGLFGRTHLYLDFGEDIDGDPKELAMPMGDGRDDVSKSKVSRGGLKALRVIEPVWTYPTTYNAINPLRSDWYNPQIWYVMSKQVHVSRLLPFIGRPVPDLLKPAYSFGGLSLSQLALPYVDIWLQTRESVGTLVHSFSVMVLLTDMQASLEPGVTGGADILARAELWNAFRNNQGIFMLNKATEDFKNVSASLSGLHELQAQAQEHMCLQSGTSIWTDRGEVLIEQVSTSDRVLTRNGFEPIKWVGVTDCRDTFVEIEANGTVIRVTEEHPVWSQSRSDFVNASNVSHSDLLLAVPSRENMASPWLGVVDGGGKRKLGIIEIKKLAACFIESCGKLIADLFRTATRFITQTATGPIINSTILKLSPEPSMSLATAGRVAHSRSFTMPNASSAASLSVRPSTERSIALEPARRERTESAGGGFLSNCMSFLAKAATSLSPAKKAEHDSVLALACSVPVARVSVLKLPRQPVYNIEVDGLPEFFANGILVHNSSVSRIPLVKLTGISPSGLNASSEGELRAYYDTIAAYQNRFMRPHLTRVINFMQLSLWGEIDPEISFQFEPLWELSEKELGEKQKSDSETQKTYVEIGAFAPAEVRKIAIDDPHLPFGGLDPGDVPNLAAEEAAGLEPEGGRPDDPAKGEEESGPSKPPGEDEENEEIAARQDLPWSGSYEWMRGYHLPREYLGQALTKTPPAGSEAAAKWLRIGSRVRYAEGKGGRVFGFADDSVAVLDLDEERVVFARAARVTPRPVAAETAGTNDDALDP